MGHFDPFGSIFWGTIGTAMLCGTIIGLERQLRGKPAGIRTSILVCLSSAIFIDLSTDVIGGGDPTRVLGQLVTGVGFLGGGVMFSRDGVVNGVTTAAVIWILAAIGSVVGFGHFLGAIALSLVTVTLLVGIGLLESGVRWMTRGVHRHDPKPAPEPDDLDPV